MASSITITQINPSVAHFRVVLDAPPGGDISFRQSGAVGAEKDLTALGPGPLKAYLSRLTNWAELSIPTARAKVVWRLVQANNNLRLPVVGGTAAYAATIALAGATAVTFVPGAGAGALNLELAFIHSASR